MQSIQSNEGKPKLYITQPSLIKPTRTMQSYFHSEDEKEVSNTDHIDAEQLKQEVVDNLNKKTFKEMTIEEKIIYFSSMPFQAPKVKCQVVTNEKSYIGIIQDYDQDSVKIKVAGKVNSVSVKMDQIEEINLVGF